ncbi:SHOCT domain-containing protein [Cellulomonas chengniuliangii]|uniref:SHOCT domain-containing protein n=1 Tax=Cellulomonas chengniuliangii TaxID=2968084 RepID=A0ABY5KZH5_9CELL|nr:SHOCT domain-containing protein [Cellulomonas chengniuliangii]MCC2309196.1 SHOCT domain-containing protein [Cellulomonas chengniuliangii]MCC2318540.1 SHOCT domain-containing protein [Cellulomonas chengniuliangii]UUI75223.1 SHOCT domain-containing protein [Cellulomonas chengniuliangii]
MEWDSVWDFLWIAIWAFLFVVYLMILFQILADIFRDRGLSGWWKALWIIGLVVFPFLTALLYIIFRGTGMAHRQAEAAQHVQAETDQYIRQVAGRSPAQEIQHAKELYDAGVIDDAEFTQLKAKALA